MQKDRFQTLKSLYSYFYISQPIVSFALDFKISLRHFTDEKFEASKPKII